MLAGVLVEYREGQGGLPSVSTIGHRQELVSREG